MKLFMLAFALLTLIGCDKKEPVATKEASNKPASMDFWVRSEAGEKIKVLTISEKGDLFHRDKQITTDDEIIASLYDLVISNDNTITRCLSKLELYRQGSVNTLMKRVVQAENEALKKAATQEAEAKAATEKPETTQKK